MECLKKLLWRKPSKDILQIPRPDPQRNLNKSLKPTDFDEKIIYDEVFQKLFRIFLIFSRNYEDSTTDCDQNSDEDNVFKQNGKLLIFIRKFSANYLINQMIELNHQLNEHNTEHSTLKHLEHFKSEKVTFQDLLQTCINLFPNREYFDPIVGRIFDRYVRQIVSKGFIMCREYSKNNFTTSNMCCFGKSNLKQRWQPFWCVLIPGTIYLYPLNKGFRKSDSKNQQILCKKIVVDSETVIKSEASEKLTIAEENENDRLIWSVETTSNKRFEFCHFNELERQIWISDMKMVSQNSNWISMLRCDNSLSKEKLKKSVDSTASQPPTCQRHRRSLSRPRNPLEIENQKLKEMLDAERKALYDEEIVRQLATRMLDEEIERSDQFRQTIEFLSEQLALERNHRLFLEKRLFEAAELVEQNPSTQNPLVFKKDNEEDVSGFEDDNSKLFKDFLIISTQSV